MTIGVADWAPRRQTISAARNRRALQRSKHIRMGHSADNSIGLCTAMAFSQYNGDVAFGIIQWNRILFGRTTSGRTRESTASMRNESPSTAWISRKIWKRSHFILNTNKSLLNDQSDEHNAVEIVLWHKYVWLVAPTGYRLFYYYCF